MDEEEEEKQLVNMETSYLQLVRISKEIHDDLNMKNKLVKDSYNNYLIESQKLIAKWQLSSEKSKHLYEKVISKDEKTLGTIEGLKEKFVSNMHAVKVRLAHLDPVKHFKERAKNYEKKLEHYQALLNKAQLGEKTRIPEGDILNEIENVKKLITALLLEEIGDDEVLKTTAHLESLIK